MITILVFLILMKAKDANVDLIDVEE